MDLKGIEALIASLNSDQRAAAEIGPGAVVVSGGPGSGKTRVLTARVARMARDGLDPRFVLAMTFTKMAAEEMNERLSRLQISGGHISTIHSLSLSILKESAADLLMGVQLDETGYKMTTEMQRTLGDLRRDKVLRRNDAPDLDGLKRYVARVKAHGYAPVWGNPFGMNQPAEEELLTYSEEFYNESGGLDAEQLAAFYLGLEARRAASHLYDFDDMQLWAWMTLMRRPDVLRSWRRWSVVMMDEAQDSSQIQWDMARLMAGGASRIDPSATAGDPKVPPVLMALGEVSQSIYAWRSAVPEWFLDFAKAEGVRLIPMPVNYRSTPEICWATSRVVDGQPWHLTGEIKSSQGDEIVPAVFEATITTEVHPTLYEEACAALDHMEARCEGDWTRGVVMSRLAMFLHLVEVECIRRKIPYEKRAAGAFFDSQEVQDIVAYLRVASGWDNRDRKWLKRCIRRPFRYIGRNALSWADDECRRSGETDYLGLLQQAPMLSLRQKRAVRALEETLESLERMIRDGTRPDKCIRFVMDDTMYLDWLREEGGAMQIDASKIAILDHVQQVAAAHPDVTSFISQLDALAQGVLLGRQQLRRNAKQKDAGPVLVLSTIHRCKGLEWDHVALCDVATDRFPWNKGHSMDEETRLLYVAISRARKTVRVSAAGSASSFLNRVELMVSGLTSPRDQKENPETESGGPEGLNGLTRDCLN